MSDVATQAFNKIRLIAGEIFYDLNEDGCQDPAEGLVMEAVNVSLYACGDTPGVDMPVASTTVTDGIYVFGVFQIF